MYVQSIIYKRSSEAVFPLRCFFLLRGDEDPGLPVKIPGRIETELAVLGGTTLMACRAGDTGKRGRA